MMTPDISVLLPVYNAAPFLQVALDSLTAQTWISFEVIAVNDGSTDESLDILLKHSEQDARFKIISRPNTGIVEALNEGLAAAKGRFLARMDADDEAAPTRFELQRDRMITEPKLVALGSAVTFMDPNGHSVQSCPRPLGHEAIERLLLTGDGGAMIHPAMMFQTEVLRSVGGYIPSTQYLEDLDLYLRLALVGTLANLPQSLLRYRVHEKSINFTRTNERAKVKTAILQTAYRARGIAFETIPAAAATGHDDPSGHAKEWAVTSLQFGSRRVAVSHGLRAIYRAPRDLGSWRALKLALTATIVSA